MITLVLLGAPGALTAGERRYVEGEVLIRYKPQVSAQAQGAHYGRLGAVRVRTLHRIGVHHLRLPRGMAVEEAVRRLREHPDVEHVEPNYLRRAAVLPNDPSFDQQWGLHNEGQTIGGVLTGTPDADIDAPEAWDIHTGDGSVVVAVLDTGVDHRHEDLAANIWQNTAETNCTDLFDQDGNGFVNDCTGWDFANNDNDPMDDSMDGHGTQVAGVIGAVGENGIGISGVNWRVRIMPLKFLGADGTGSVADEIEAIDYAIDNGAQVINGSFGDQGFSQFEQDAVQRAMDAGILFVAAAGNNSEDNDTIAFYPASHPLESVISVAASDFNDNLADFTNFGPSSVHLAAPGAFILSTAPSDSYEFVSGTSFSTPAVSGTAALLISFNPTLDFLGVKELILTSVDDLGLPLITGGRLNARGTLSALAAPSGLVADAFPPSSIQLTWGDVSTAETEFRIEREPGGSFSEIAIVAAGTTSFTDTGLPPGAYSYRVRAAGSAGFSPYSNVATAFVGPALSVSPLTHDFGGVTVGSASPALEITLSNPGTETLDVLNMILSDVTTLSLDTGGGSNPCGSQMPSLPPGISCTIEVTFTPDDAESVSGTLTITSTDPTTPVIVISFTGTGTVSGSSKKNGCFIATAAYGSALAPEVAVLRQFRDRRLLTNRPGRILVQYYYLYSPPAAEYIERHPLLRATVRLVLTPLVYGVKHPLGAFALAVGAAAMAFYRRVTGKRRNKTG